jgi:hypothetical protein
VMSDAIGQSFGYVAVSIIDEVLNDQITEQKLIATRFFGPPPPTAMPSVHPSDAPSMQSSSVPTRAAHLIGLPTAPAFECGSSKT